MNLTQLKNVTGRLTLIGLLASPLVSSATLPYSSPGSITVETPVVSNSKTASVAARPANRSAASVKSVAMAKEQKHDKHTINRCWSRLMTMAREANTAHRNKKD